MSLGADEATVGGNEGRYHMTLRRASLAFLGLVGVAAALAPLGAGASAGHATVKIRHQLRGCHTWSVNGGSYAPSRTLRLSRPGTITVVNNDIMPHTLRQVSGPKVRIRSARMGRMAAKARVSFGAAGVYRFTTKAGEDYPGMDMRTVGEDYVLHLTVRVS